MEEWIFRALDNQDLSSIEVNFENKLADVNKSMKNYPACKRGFLSTERLKHSIGADECLTRQKIKHSIR